MSLAFSHLAEPYSTPCLNFLAFLALKYTTRRSATPPTIPISKSFSEKRKQRAENDPEYAKYLEERNAEYNRRHTARRKEQMEALRARAEAGDQEAQSQLAERKQYQVRATVKSYRKMREDALNGDTIAKERYEKTLAMRREAYHSKKSEQTA
jgi:site-specific DNA recombinase